MKHDLMIRISIKGLLTCVWILYLINGGAM